MHWIAPSRVTVDTLPAFVVKDNRSFIACIVVLAQQAVWLCSVDHHLIRQVLQSLLCCHDMTALGTRGMRWLCLFDCVFSSDREVAWQANQGPLL